MGKGHATCSIFIDFEMVIDIALKLGNLKAHAIHQTRKTGKVKVKATKVGNHLESPARRRRVEEASSISDNTSIEETGCFWSDFKLLFKSQEGNEFTRRARVSVYPEEITIGIIVWMVVNLDQKIAACVAFVIDARGVGCIADNDQGTGIVLICDSIHVSHPSKSRLVKASS